jgi:perosamine synthetase
MDLSNISVIPDDTAIMVVHNLGNIINVPKIHRRFPESVIIEDNCEGFMGKYEKQYSGTDCVASSVSFFVNKLITAGEGGAVFTNNDHIANHIQLVKSQGQSSKRFVHEICGNNFRMTNLQAALILGQLQHLSEIIEQKKFVFDYYKKHLENEIGIALQKVEQNTEPANWMFGVRFIGNESYEKADRFFGSCEIETRPMFYSIREHKHLNHINMESDVVAQQLSKEIVILPSYPGLTRSELDYIIDKVLIYKEKV